MKSCSRGAEGKEVLQSGNGFFYLFDYFSF